MLIEVEKDNVRGDDRFSLDNMAKVRKESRLRKF
jgi:hypothetical protein